MLHHVAILCCQSNGIGSLGYHKHHTDSHSITNYRYRIYCSFFFDPLCVIAMINSILYIGSSQHSHADELIAV